MINLVKVDWKAPWKEIQEEFLKLSKFEQDRILKAREKRMRKQLATQKLLKKNKEKND